MKLEMFPQLDRNIPHVEEYILSYLQPKDLAASMLVSKEWSQRAKPLLCKCYAYIQRKNGNVPLQSAVIDGYEHLVAFFLQEKQINVNEISKKTGMTALMEVACNGKDQIAKMLLGREDIRVNMHSFKDNSPYPALHLAALYGHVDRSGETASGKKRHRCQFPWAVRQYGIDFSTKEWSRRCCRRTSKMS